MEWVSGHASREAVYEVLSLSYNAIAQAKKLRGVSYFLTMPLKNLSPPFKNHKPWISNPAKKYAEGNPLKLSSDFVFILSCFQLFSSPSSSSYHLWIFSSINRAVAFATLPSIAPSPKATGQPQGGRSQNNGAHLGWGQYHGTGKCRLQRNTVDTTPSCAMSYWMVGLDTCPTTKFWNKHRNDTWGCSSLRLLA